LMDVVESLIGAAFLDGGWKAASKVVRHLFKTRWDVLSRDAWAGNPKGRLQEYCQRRWKAGPTYRMVGRQGAPHEAVYTVEVVAGGCAHGQGSGRSKQQAESDAARAALASLGIGENEA
jgi:ribonuclease III